MSLEHWAYLAQIVGTVGLIVSLLFVGYQIRQNTNAVQRSEHNSTMEQWTVIRQSMVRHRDVAELMTSGLQGVPIDPASQLRLEQMLQEIAWAAFHIWDRTQRGVFPKGTFEWTGGAYLSAVLHTPFGAAWWQRSKHIGFHPAYVVDVDRVLSHESAAGSGAP